MTADEKRTSNGLKIVRRGLSLSGSLWDEYISSANEAWFALIDHKNTEKIPIIIPATLAVAAASILSTVRSSDLEYPAKFAIVDVFLRLNLRI
jgi:hypothetical protein